MKKEKLDSLILDCLKEIYRHTTPSADLDYLMSSGETKKEGWFDEYTITQVSFESILGRWIDRYSLKGTDLQYFRTNLYLGPSPRFT